MPQQLTSLTALIKRDKSLGCIHTNFYYLSPKGERFPYSCRSWSCPKCNPKNRRRLRAQILDAAHKNGLSRFATVTLDPKKLIHRRITPEDSFAFISNIWKKFSIMLRRLYPQFQYYKVNVTQSQTGNAHIHFLSNIFIPQRTLSKIWASCGGGKICHIEAATPRSISGYISKYLSDDHKNEFIIPKGHRHYSHSRRLELTKLPHEDGWLLMVFDYEKRPDYPDRLAERSDFIYSIKSAILRSRLIDLPN